MMHVIGRLVLAAGILLTASTAQAAFPSLPKALAVPKSSPIAMRERVAAPAGAYRLCYQTPAHCSPRRARGLEVRDGRVVVTAAAWELIQAVNLRVNRSIRPVVDGNDDIWKIGGRSGDCEDFALAKRDLLIRRGFPSSSVLVATAYTRSGMRHAVLVVRTDRGDFVLDNLHNAAKPWSASGLRFESIQSPNDPRIWQRI